MNRTAITLAAPFVLAVAPAALAQQAPAETPPAERNAAVEYWRAATLLRSGPDGALTREPGRATDLDATLEAVKWDQFGATINPAELPQAFHDAADIVSDDAMAAFVRAADTPAADFQVQYTQGPRALLTHLPEIRRLARAARISARAKLILNEPGPFADRIAALYRAAGHLGHDRVLISSLVAAAIANSAGQEVDAAVQSGRLTPAARDRIIAAIRSLPKDDPFGFTGSVRGERVLVVDWARREFTGPTAGRDFARTYAGFTGGEPGEQEAFGALVAMNEQQFGQTLDQLDRYYEQILAVWSAPDAEAQLEAIDARASAGDFGPATRIVAAAFSKARAAMTKAHDQLRAAEAKLAEPGQNPAPAAGGQN